MQRDRFKRVPKVLRVTPVSDTVLYVALLDMFTVKFPRYLAFLELRGHTL